MPQTHRLTKQEIEKLLATQTTVILKAVDEKFAAQDVAVVGQIEKSLHRVEGRFGDKLNRLMATLDRFLKRLTDFEDEFELLKREVSRMKAAMRDKLGVTVD